MLQDVCKRINVSYHEGVSVELLENSLLANISHGMWKEFSEEDKQTLLQELKKYGDWDMRGILMHEIGIQRT